MAAKRRRFLHQPPPQAQSVQRTAASKSPANHARVDHPLGRYAELGNTGLQRLLRSGSPQDKALLIGRTLARVEATEAHETEAAAPSDREKWASNVTAPLSEASAILRQEQPSTADLAAAYEKLKQALPDIDSLVDEMTSANKVTAVHVSARHLYSQIIVLGRGIQPHIGITMEMGELAKEAIDAAGSAGEMQADLATAFPGWTAEVSTPLSEAAAVLSRADASPEEVVEVRQRIRGAFRAVNAATEMDVEGYVGLRLHGFLRDVAMLLRGVNPHAGIRAEISDLATEAEEVREFAASLAEDI